MNLNLHNSEFLTSAVDSRGYPNHALKEVAFVGRSNVGKSSLINALVNRNKFARTSNQPGRTQTINFYRVDTICLVDLPGYGFAKVSKEVKQHWGQMIETYLTDRLNLVGVLQLIDVRHKPSEDDQLMINWFREMDMPHVLIATKLDKISRGRYQQHAKIVREIMGADPILFSSQSKQGRSEVLGAIKSLMENADAR